MARLHPLALLAVVLLVGACQAQPAPPAASGQTEPVAVPPLELTDLDGHPVSLAALKGKVVIIDFWATWCPPCVGEMPDMNRLYKELKDKNFTVVGISMDTGSERPVKALADKMGIAYPILMGSNNIAKQFGEIIGIPVSFLVDRQGKVIKRYDGPRGYNVFLEDIEEVLW